MTPPTRPKLYITHNNHDSHPIATMADEKPAAQAPAAAEGSENQHTDPVTGEKISKSELKRREKQREREKKKAEKEAAMPARPKAEGKKTDVEELNPNVRMVTSEVTCVPGFLHESAISLEEPDLL